MHKIVFLTLVLALLLPGILLAQKTEVVYLDAKDSTANMYVAVIPESQPKAFLFLLDGFGASPGGVLRETEIPLQAASQGIITIIPLLKTGALYFGTDDA
ncbi:hypothetical protein ACFOTA_16780 [Chitinophaga sp. GCM10012297]|uniref:Uncharacterized protein n=1 Tax=Chitinophaga chungangae TaxID=2821488 RepID=A0ABS3YGT3_9BACT|nr:hypothetical protein [Chitinophaga chungangae]MBO9153877.1 hypothetical protein [Chitinophaga chungangae]